MVGDRIAQDKAVEAIATSFDGSGAASRVIDRRVMERLADEWGRDIRYGDLPRNPEAVAAHSVWTRRQAVAKVIELGNTVARHEENEATLSKFEPDRLTTNLSITEGQPARAKHEAAERGKALQGILQAVTLALSEQEPSP